jgi:hypothetical protein
VTAVAIWPEAGQLWVVADTRLSGATGVLTDSASKIYALPVVCRPPNMLGTLLGSEPHFEGTFGVAFAGSSLAATHTIATATSCLNQLAGVETDGPSVREVAMFVQMIGSAIGNQIAAGMSRPRLEFEVAVFGWCRNLGSFAIYTLRPDPNANPPMLCLGLEEHLPISSADVVTLGDGGSRLSDERAKIIGVVHLKPKVALASILEREGPTGTVGGSLSIGTCVARPGGFQIRSWAKATSNGVHLTYNGIDVHDTTVGGYRINFRGYG